MTFENILFENHFAGGIKGKLKVNGHVLSVIAGAGFYSTPRENLTTPNEFTKFEVAVFDDGGNFVTNEIVEGITDDVMGWQTREDINNIIETILNK